MNYIGSKFSLLPEIRRVLDENSVPNTGIALDLFTGTSVVAQMLKQRGHVVYANDWQHYSYLTAISFIENNELPTFDSLMNSREWGGRIAGCPPLAGVRSSPIDDAPPVSLGSPAFQVLFYLSHLPEKPGRFYDAYCEGGKSGRQYYTRENGMRIQAIRDEIEEWDLCGLLARREKAWLVSALIEGADRVANTASVYGAYLKHVKQSARKSLVPRAPIPVPSRHAANEHQAFCLDGQALLRQIGDNRLRLVYIDPPYNQRQYNGNYHVLETIARWDLDDLEPRGTTGLRKKGENKSMYCSKTHAKSAFHQLIGLVNADYVLFSYSNEGLLSRNDLEAMFAEFCSDVRFEEIHYRRFRADLDGENRVYSGDYTKEFLVLGRMTSGRKIT